MIILVLQRIALDLLIDVIRFPVWWYTGGLKYAFVFAADAFRTGNTYLAPGLWLTNLFVPMYGQRDIGGRLTSFFVRLVNVIIRGAILAVWFVCSLIVFLVWPLLPLVTLYMFLISLT